MRMLMSHKDQDSSTGTDRRTFVKMMGSTAALGTIAGCSGGSGGNGTTTSPSGGGSSGAAWKKDLGTDFQFWTVTNAVMKRDSFFPSTYVVTKGSTVGFHLKNTDSEKHDFSIDAFGISGDHKAGSVDTVKFTADKAGVHEIYCDIHPPWMRGQLVVLDKNGGPIPAKDSRDLYLVESMFNDKYARKAIMPGTSVAVEGENVTIHLKNTSDMKHDFTIDAFGISGDHKAGTTDTVNFTADKPGIYRYYCDVHPPWMTGQLLVLPKDGDWSRVNWESGQGDLWITPTGVGGRDSFFPSTWFMKEGANVTAHVWNTDPDGAKHDFSIPTFGVSGDHKVGVKDTVTFTASKSGIIKYLCDIHQPQMNGQMLVIPKGSGGITSHGY